MSVIALPALAHICGSCGPDQTATGAMGVYSDRSGRQQVRGNGAGGAITGRRWYSGSLLTGVTYCRGVAELVVVNVGLRADIDQKLLTLMAF